MDTPMRDLRGWYIAGAVGVVLGFLAGALGAVRLLDRLSNRTVEWWLGRRRGQDRQPATVVHPCDNEPDKARP